MKEVYIAYGENNEVLYVGQGNIGRHKHCLGGTSHCRELNRYYFNNGENSIFVDVVFQGITKDEAVMQELLLIDKLNPKFNTVIPSNGNNKPIRKKQTNYAKTMKRYVEAINNNDKDTLAEIDRIMPECKEHIRLLGVAKIKALDYRATKIRDLYEVAKLKEKHKDDIIKLLDLEIGKSYTVNFLKVKFKEVYSQFGIKERVSMSNADYFFDTKNTQARINGKQQRVVKIEGLKL